MVARRFKIMDKVRVDIVRILLLGLFFVVLMGVQEGRSLASDMDMIKADLDNGDWQVRLSAVEKLKSMNDEKSFDLLMNIADTTVEYWPIKIQAILALGEIGNPKAIELLLKIFYNAFLNSECPSIKSYTAIALGNFKNDDRVVNALILGINDGETLTREASINSLGKIGNSKAIPFLGAVTTDRSFAIRSSAIKALEKINDPKAIPYLKKVAENDSDPELRMDAAAAVKQLTL